MSRQGSYGGDLWPGKEIAVKKFYEGRLDAEERDRLTS